MRSFSLFSVLLSFLTLFPEVGMANQCRKVFRNISDLDRAKKILEIEKAQADFFRYDLRGLPTRGELAPYMNKAVLEYLKKYRIEKRPGRITEASSRDAKLIYERTDKHPVASLDSYRKYAGETEVGLCWGRAMTAHLEALRYGINKDSIKKIWIVGNLQAGETKWSYHVATIIRGGFETWHVIDPIMGKPMTVENWYKQMKQMDGGGDARIYVTHPSRYGIVSDLPYLPELSDRQSFENNDYQGYFSDLLGYYRQESAAISAEIRKPK